jgi:hypothetical protein
MNADSLIEVYIHMTLANEPHPTIKIKWRRVLGEIVAGSWRRNTGGGILHDEK